MAACFESLLGCSLACMPCRKRMWHCRWLKSWTYIYIYVGPWWKCCFTATETVGLLGTGAQDVHLDFHTAPELCHDIVRLLVSALWQESALSLLLLNKAIKQTAVSRSEGCALEPIVLFSSSATSVVIFHVQRSSIKESSPQRLGEKTIYIYMFWYEYLLF